MIFIDLDGVLADFVGGALIRHNKPLSLADNMKWDIAAHLNMREADFWQPLDFKFWRDLPETKEYNAIAAKLRCRNYTIITTPPPIHCEEAIEGKRQWLGARGLNNVLFAHKKHWLMRPGDVLIDDADHNYNAALLVGFDARLIPRPWNQHAGNRVNIDAIFEGL